MDCEADQRHAEIIIRELSLLASPHVATARMRQKIDDENDDVLPNAQPLPGTSNLLPAPPPCLQAFLTFTMQ